MSENELGALILAARTPRITRQREGSQTGLPRLKPRFTGYASEPTSQVRASPSGAVGALVVWCSFEPLAPTGRARRGGSARLFRGRRCC